MLHQLLSHPPNDVVFSLFQGCQLSKACLEVFDDLAFLVTLILFCGQLHLQRLLLRQYPRLELRRPLHEPPRPLEAFEVLV